jgi:hypothetical protein
MIESKGVEPCLNGSKIPPLVPNVIDVRITHYEVTRNRPRRSVKH